jgi:hypothetical protein
LLPDSRSTNVSGQRTYVWERSGLEDTAWGQAGMVPGLRVIRDCAYLGELEGVKAGVDAMITRTTPKGNQVHLDETAIPSISGAQAGAKDVTQHVVILVHGIRDYALWQDAIRKVLKDQFTVESTNYGRFDLFRFLVPIRYFRERAIESVWNQIRDVKKQYPSAKFSFVAHSFGTYILAQILSREFDFAAYRVIFCGSVIKYNFPFEQFADRFATPILNEVGARDVWPAIAESVTWGYGSAGTYGFRRPRVRDRWHPGARHGYFLDPEFCRKYWIPFLKDGTITEAATNPEVPPVWLKSLSVIRLKYVLLAVLAAILVAFVLRINWSPPAPIRTGAAPTPVQPAAPQSKQISGIVTDESDAPIRGAKVVLMGSSDSTVTQEDGGFSLPVHESDELVRLSITKDGFHPLSEYYSVRREVRIILHRQ